MKTRKLIAQIQSLSPLTDEAKQRMVDVIESAQRISKAVKKYTKANENSVIELCAAVPKKQIK